MQDLGRRARAHTTAAQIAAGLGLSRAQLYRRYGAALRRRPRTPG